MECMPNAEQTCSWSLWLRFSWKTFLAAVLTKFTQRVRFKCISFFFWNFTKGKFLSSCSLLFLESLRQETPANRMEKRHKEKSLCAKWEGTATNTCDSREECRCNYTFLSKGNGNHDLVYLGFEESSLQLGTRRWSRERGTTSTIQPKEQLDGEMLWLV